MAKWFYLVDGQEIGPLESAALKQLATSGRISPDDKVRRSDLSQWHSAKQIKGLLFNYQTPAASAMTEAPPAVSRDARATPTSSKTPVDRRVTVKRPESSTSRSVGSPQNSDRTESIVRNGTSSFRPLIASLTIAGGVVLVLAVATIIWTNRNAALAPTADQTNPAAIHFDRQPIIEPSYSQDFEKWWGPNGSRNFARNLQNDFEKHFRFKINADQKRYFSEVVTPEIKMAYYESYKKNGLNEDKLDQSYDAYSKSNNKRWLNDLYQMCDEQQKKEWVAGVASDVLESMN